MSALSTEYTSVVKLQNTQWLLSCQSKVSGMHILYTCLWMHTPMLCTSTVQISMSTSRMVHAFTCAGILPRQYIRFSQFAEMGAVHERYIHSSEFCFICALYLCLHLLCTVYVARLYCDVVNKAAEESMSRAVEDIKGFPSYATNGEVGLCVLYCPLIYCIVKWVITDARHDSTANAYHSTVPCLSGRYMQSCDIGVWCQCYVYQHSQGCGDLYTLSERT